MSRAIKSASALAAALLTVALPAWAAKQKPIDLSTPEGATLAQRKVQCSAKDGEPTVYWFHGEGFSRVPGERDRKLFNVEGMNIRQCVTVNDPVRGAGWRLVSRELLLYVDPATGELLREWKNPWTNQTVKVLQTANDPVNQRPVFPRSPEGKANAWNATMSGNQWWSTLTVPLFYSNPLAGDYQKQIGGFYHATEMFNFFGNIDELTDPKNLNPAIRVGWVRIADWLPWMDMSGRAGEIYIHAAGRKLDRFEQLPPVVLKEIETTYPEWRQPPPGDDARENETSWTYFKKKFPVAAPKK